jgi:predicted porin
MNKNIKLAVAGAVLALSATANAGIIIPAGDWTVDLSGNVNAFMSTTRNTGDNAVAGGLAMPNGTGTKNANTISTGLLPNFLSVAGSSRQNDLDVTFLISINPGGFSSNSASGGSGTEHRQAFMTFGDKSWGSIKIGKDLGIYASDAILSDMTLLGVGASAGKPLGTTTLGGIGSGYQYADWKQQIAYTTPNMGGFQATVGVTQAWNAWSTANSTATAAGLYANGTEDIVTTPTAVTFSGVSSQRAAGSPAFEGKASYSFTGSDVTGKVWVSAFGQKVKGIGSGDTVWSSDIGANVNAGGFGLTGYYYTGEGTGTTFLLADAFSTDFKKRDVDGGYVQATYVLPTKTKIGASYGVSNLDRAGADTANALVKSNERYTVGVYHPLTKSVNLVAEYNATESEAQSGVTGKAKGVSLGGILFF